jgi:hypothetical protein
MMVPRITMIMVLGAWAGCLDSSLGDVTSVNLPANQLQIEPQIVDADAAPADGKVPVVVQFFHASDYVKLASGSVSANGVPLPWGSTGYAARIPIVPPGGSILFAYTRAGTTTQFTYPVPPRPVVTSPVANDAVLRSLNLMITYVSSSSFGVRPLAADSGFGVTGGEQSDTGTAFLDVSGLRPGSGSVGVTRRLVSTPPDNGFQSAAVTYDITSLPTPVIWQ